MKKSEEELLSKLREGAKTHHPTLVPHPFYKDKFQVSFFYVEDHIELMLHIQALLNICILAMDSSELVKRPSPETLELYVRQVLTLANRLLPQGETALLDDVNAFFRNEELRKHMDKT
ncbi:hypothetical protein ED312_08675 [Sinomicrobium pectinilyticum]|uniref:Uncharacterized protein n=1 Tax=Sinomicrobium pectinilyticum TaxID=1084421 RepID=A0A3N0EL62_SINP1|nr:hypothetical protein [Sinomicrobium pectinilyticum]RNL88512.1 hypothetical protein ED312_08675 [Sinomicrobium pectinilyticum]